MPITAQISSLREFRSIRRTLVYVCAGLLTAAGILFRTLLGLTTVGAELVALLVPLAIGATAVCCWCKLPVEESLRAHSIIWMAVLTALGILAVILSDFIRQSWESAQAWGSVLFCAAGVLLLYALRKEKNTGFLFLVAYLGITTAFMWLFSSTAGAVLIACSAIVLEPLVIKRRWFCEKRQNSIFMLFAIVALFFIICIGNSDFILRRLDDKLFPLEDVIPNIENASARLTAMNAAAFGRADFCGVYDEYVSFCVSFPKAEYLLSSVLYHYGWVCVAGIVILMLAMAVLCCCQCSGRKGLNFYLPITLCIYLCTQVALYLAQAFGFCIVRTLYVPFFSGQAVGGTLSLLSLLLIVEGLKENEPPVWETTTEFERILLHDEEKKESRDVTEQFIYCLAFPEEIADISGVLFSDTLYHKDCDEETLKDILHPKVPCASMMISGAISEVRLRLCETISYPRHLVLIKVEHHEQVDKIQLQALLDALQKCFSEPPKHQFIFLHTFDKSFDRNFCSVSFYIQ